MRHAAAALPGLALVALVACVSPPPGPDGRVDPDPYQGSNRAVFRFNDGVDRYFVEPLATGWEFVTPEFLRVALDKAFKNLRFPGRLLANLGQGELVHAGSETARFLINTSVGIAGLFDPASRIGLAQYDEDFGQMFGRWGIPSGPYWMVPFLGPSNPRDFWGGLFDSALDARILIPGAGLVALVNGRAIADPQVELAREAAVDLYVFMRDAYLQRREAQIANRELSPDGPQEPPDDDLYEIDEALYDDEAFDAPEMEPERDGSEQEHPVEPSDAPSGESPGG